MLSWETRWETKLSWETRSRVFGQNRQKNGA